MVSRALTLPGIRVFADPRFRLVAALMLLLAAIALTWLGFDGYRQMQDFRHVFLQAATAAWHGSSPYTPLHYARPGEFLAGSTGSIYTPSFLFLLWPWTWLSAGTGELAWFALEVGALVGTVLLVYNGIGRPSAAELVLVVAVLLLLPPLRDDLNDGQLGIFLGFGLALALWAHQRGRPVIGGIGLGLATALKITPIGAAIFLLWRRDWKLLGAALAVLAATSVATLAVGWGHYWPGFVSNLAFVSSGTAHPLNQSLNGLVLRWLRPGLTGQPIPSPGLAARAVWAVLQLAVAAVVLAVGLPRKGADALDDWARYSMLLLALPLLSPFAWPHHYAQALVAVPVGIRLVARGRTLPIAALVAGTLLVAVVLFEFPVTIAATAELRTLGDHPVLSLADSLLLLAVLTWIWALRPRARV
jgi:Glycosyltransferase family 87